MTPEQKIKFAIISLTDTPYILISTITADNIDEIYESIEEDHCYYIADEFREGEFETHLPYPYSRHYECKSVAAQMPDGSYVGWNYWYGGGEHGDPLSINWMSEAYNLDVVEEEKMVIVRTFTIKNEALDNS